MSRPPEAVHQPLRAVTVGDIMIDHLIDISDGRTNGMPKVNRCYFTPIRTAVSGLGFTFAQYAATSGFAESFLYGAIGTDPADPSRPDLGGQMVLSEVERTGIAARLAAIQGQSTGKVAMIYCTDRDRIIVSERGANAGLKSQQLDELDLAPLDGADVTFISGYFLVDPEQRQAMRQIMRRARASGGLVVVDVVPHEIWQTVPAREYLSWIEDANSLMITNYTLLDYLGRDSGRAGWDAPQEMVTAADLSPLMQQFELLVCVLNSKSDYLVVDREQFTVVRIPHASYKAVQSRDSMLAHAQILAAYLLGGRSLSEIGRWPKP